MEEADVRGSTADERNKGQQGDIASEGKRQDRSDSTENDDQAAQEESEQELGSEQSEDEEQPNLNNLKGESTSTTNGEAEDFSEGDGGGIDELDLKKAPVMISGNNIYVAWWSNKTGNDEILFRSSSDAGTTFGDKINLSNSTDAESQDVEIATSGDNVVVTWWERNATANEPVARLSNDNGASFGPLLKLADNGTIGEAGG